MAATKKTSAKKSEKTEEEKYAALAKKLGTTVEALQEVRDAQRKRRRR